MRGSDAFAAARLVRYLILGGPGVLLLLACTSRTPEPRVGESSRSAVVSSDAPRDSLIELTLAQPLHRLAVAALGADLRTLGFLRLEVTSVINPQRLALSIEVLQSLPQQPDSLLGLVSLFPADNPGTFVVATGGRLRADGVLTVRLVSPDSGAARDGVRLSLRPITLTAR